MSIATNLHALLNLDLHITKRGAIAIKVLAIAQELGNDAVADKATAIICRYEEYVENEHERKRQLAMEQADDDFGYDYEDQDF